MAHAKLTGTSQSSEYDPEGALIILIIELGLFFGLLFILSIL